MKHLLFAAACLGAVGLAQAADAPPPVPCAPPPCAKFCVPVPTTKRTDKVICDDRCVEYCVPRCSLWSILRSCCWGGCASCGRLHTRHVLIKKIVHEECPDVRCEVRDAPCGPPCVPIP
jgi:hypothetical protein